MSKLTGNHEAVSVLASLLRPSDNPCPLVLLGAGASLRSGVPTATGAVRHIARLMYSERVLRGSRRPERVKPSEWESWLRTFDLFIPGADRVAENFSLVVQHLLTPSGFRMRVTLELMRPVDGISDGFYIIACIAGRGVTRRREDTKDLLVATRGKVLTLQNPADRAVHPAQGICHEIQGEGQ